MFIKIYLLEFILELPTSQLDDFIKSLYNVKNNTQMTSAADTFIKMTDI